VTGFFSGTANFGTTNLATTGLDDVFVAKYNPSGNLQWARKIGGGNLDVGYAIAVDAATNICVTGFFYATATFGSTNFTSSGFDDLFLLKLGTAPRPSLAIVKSSGNVKLSWPLWATNVWLFLLVTVVLTFASQLYWPSSDATPTACSATVPRGRPSACAGSSRRFSLLMSSHRDP